MDLAARGWAAGVRDIVEGEGPQSPAALGRCWRVAVEVAVDWHFFACACSCAKTSASALSAAAPESEAHEGSAWSPHVTLLA